MKGKNEVLSNNIASNQKTKRRLAASLSEYKYISLAAIIPAVLFFLIYLVRGLYPFGNGTVLVLDLNGQYVYFFEALRNKVLEGGSLLYSWSRALGGEFLGIYAYYIASPLSYLICLFPKERTQEFLLVMFMIKAALCGGTMGFYLHKHSEKRNKLSIVAFAVMYAMSAYCVVQQNNTMWIDAVMWLPLVAYGVEQLIKFGKYKLFVIFLSLTLASNFYIGYMVCIFVLLYFFFYHFAFCENNANNPNNERSHFLKSFIRIGCYSILAIGMAAVIVLGAYYSLQFGKNDFTDPSWDIFLRIDILDIFFKMLPSSYDTVRIDGLPFIYCGLLTAVLAPLFFCCKKFTTREKVVCGIFLAIFILSFMISVLDLVWHGFQKPQWLNNRYSFMFCFFLLTLAFRAFENIEYVDNKCIGCVTAFIVLIVALFQAFAKEYQDKLIALKYGPKEEDFQIHVWATIVLTLVCLVVYIVIIALMKHSITHPVNLDLVSAVLLCVICVEVFLSGLCNINDLDEDVGYTKYSYYNEFQTLYRPVTETLLETDRTFYRFEKTYHRKLNDNMALSIKGLSNSTSTLNKSTITFLHQLGYYSSSHKSQYIGGNPVGDSLLGLKYIISERDLSHIYGDPVLTGEDYAKYMGMTLDELKEATFADQYKDLDASMINVYKNPYALSLAFAANPESFDLNMKDYNIFVNQEKNPEKYNPDGYKSPFTRLNALITAILDEDETVEVFKPATMNGDPTVSDGVKVSVSSNHNKYEGEKGDSITYSYTVPEGVNLYLYFPAYYNRAIKLSSDTMKIADGTTKLDSCNERIVELGYTTGTEYELTVKIDSDSKLFYTMLDDAYVYYVDMDVLNEAFSRLQSEQMIMSEDYNDDDIRGTITTLKGNKTILTTIPYDKGWEVYVDGERVETTEALDSLVAFDIESAGEHSIRFLYRPTTFKLGITISAISFACFILIMVFEKILKKIVFIRNVFTVPELEVSDELSTEQPQNTVVNKKRKKK